MTWEEWLGSPYNDTNLSINYDDGVWFEYITYIFADARCTQMCYKDDVIQAQAYYGDYSPYVEDFISFSINNVQYQAAPDMTWEEWINSSWNQPDFKIKPNTTATESPVVYTRDTWDVQIGYNNAPVFRTDSIVAGRKYVFGYWDCYTYQSLHYHDETLYTGWCGGDYWENGVYMAGCFIAGTKVLMADGTTKAIEDIYEGERVISYNRHTNEFFEVVVVQAMKDEYTNAYFEVELEDGTILGLTGNHPILTNKGYECIFGESLEVLICDKLGVGDMVFTTDGYKKIKRITRHNGKISVYNLSVASDDEVTAGVDDDTEDTFIVEGVIAHNVVVHGGGSN